MSDQGAVTARRGHAWGPADLTAAGIVLAAAALRFYGLRWGLPNDLHAYSYHPDEFRIVDSARVVLQAGIPSFYNYPSLFVYLSAAAIAIANGLGASTTLGAYLAARSVAALMGTAAVAATYWAGKRLFGGWAGVVAALVVCVAPLHVQQAHFATVDVPSTLFVATALGYAGMILVRGAWADFVLAGVMAGLAAGTKYNAGLILLAPLAAHFLAGRRGVRSGRMWGMIGCAAAAFVASTPGIVLRWSDFWLGLMTEMRHSAQGQGLLFAGTGNGLLYTFTSSLWNGLGPGLAVPLLAAGAFALWRREKRALVILAFAIPYYALISASHVRFARYALPLFPAAALLCAWAVHEWLPRPAPTRPARAVWGIVIAFCAAAIASSLIYAVALDVLFALPDARDDAARWIQAHVPRGSAVGVIDVPWFYSPPLGPEIGFGTRAMREEAARTTPYDLIVFARCPVPGCWAESVTAPQWVVLSDYETADAQRLREDRLLDASKREQVDRILTDVGLVEKEYERRAGFGGRLGAPGSSRLPHDMRYADPEIAIYERRR